MTERIPLARLIQDHPLSPLQWPQKIRVAVLLALYFAVALGSIVHTNWVYDESDHLQYGLNILHGNPDRFDDSKMPVSTLNGLPWVLAEHLPEGRLRDALSSLFAARVPTVLAALLLGLLIYCWARELYGARAGLLALCLFTIDANLLAYARWATTDLYAALGVTVALYFFWRFQRDGGLKTGLGSALALGFAQIMKYTSVFLVPLCAILAAVRHWPALAATFRERNLPQARAQMKATLGYAALFALIVLLVINASYLFRKSFTPLGEYEFRSELFQSVQQTLPASLPIPVPYPYLEGLDWVRERERLGSIFGSLYLLGELRDGRGFDGYYFVAYLFKVPLPIQILFVAAAIFYWRRRRSFNFGRDEAFLLIPVLFFFIYFNFLYEAQTGIRFLLVAFPLMHVFTASLLAPQSEPGRRRGPIIGVLLLAGAASTLSYHPHYLSYFNELMPDRKQAYRILSDSNVDMGGSEYWVERWLERHPEAVFQPETPVAGTIVVGVNIYTGVIYREWFAWLRELGNKPVGHVAYSYLVFEVTPEDLERIPEHLWREER
jgi:hypothetical protein